MTLSSIAGKFFAATSALLLAVPVVGALQGGDLVGGRYYTDSYHKFDPQEISHSLTSKDELKPGRVYHREGENFSETYYRLDDYDMYSRGGPSVLDTDIDAKEAQVGYILSGLSGLMGLSLAGIRDEELYGGSANPVVTVAVATAAAPLTAAVAVKDNFFTPEPA